MYGNMFQSDKYLYAKQTMPTEAQVLTSFLPEISVPNISLHKYLLEKLDKFSDQYLVECETHTEYSFYQLAEDSRRMASAWLDLGLKEGDNFGVMGPNCYQYVVIYLGGIIVGGIASGISFNDKFQDVSDKVIQRNIKYLAVSQKNISIAKRISEAMPITEKIILFNGGNKLNDKFELYSELIESNDPISDEMMSIPNDIKQNSCIIVNTSGSTSPTKAVVYSHYSIVFGLEFTSIPIIFGYKQTDVISCHSQLCHQTAIFQIMTAISTGSQIAIQPYYDHKSFIQNVNKFGITSALLQCSALVNLLKDEDDIEIRSLTKIISHGSVLHRDIATQFLYRYRHVKDLRQGFFQTECVAPITLMVKNSSDYQSIGFPTPNTRIKITDLETGQQLMADQSGEICVQRDMCLSNGYFINRNNNLFTDSKGWLHTGNYGYYDSDGMLYCFGPIDQLIRSGASVTFSYEIETILLSHFSVRETAVIMINVENIREFTGFVVLKKEFQQKIFATDIESYVNGNLVKKKKLNGVIALNSLPKSLAGKIDKTKLKDFYISILNKRKF